MIVSKQPMEWLHLFWVGNQMATRRAMIIEKYFEFKAPSSQLATIDLLTNQLQALYNNDVFVDKYQG